MPDTELYSIKSSPDDTHARRGEATLKMCYHSKIRKLTLLPLLYLESFTKQNFYISSDPTLSNFMKSLRKPRMGSLVEM